MQEKEPRRLHLVQVARIDRNHRAVLGVLADLASRVAPLFLALAGDRSNSFWRHVSFGFIFRPRAAAELGPFIPQHRTWAIARAIRNVP
jgi:hypothetical protein